MNFGQAIGAGFRNYVNFSGVASRSEYWYWVLFTSLVRIVLSTVTGGPSLKATNTDITPIDPASLMGSAVLGLWGLAIFLPTLGVTIRRLRDAGYSPKRLFWGLAPAALMVLTLTLFVGAIATGGGLNETALMHHLVVFIPALILMLVTLAASLGIGIWFIVMLAKPSKAPVAPQYESTLY